jgi:hypothetical protein
MARNVTIHFDKRPDEDMFKALHYLSTWAYDSYPVVDIYIDFGGRSGKDFTACYRKDNSEKASYVIGALWDEQGKKYHFHS